MRSRLPHDVRSAQDALPRDRGTFVLRPRAGNSTRIDPGRSASSSFAIDSTCPGRRARLRHIGHRASSGNRGWQQENIMRSRSSWMAFDPKSSSTSGASVHALHTGCPSFGPEPECSTFPRQEIERPVLGGRHEPRRRVFRHATNAPRLQRPAEGVLYDVLRQGEVVDSEDPGQHGDHASCFAPKKMIARLDHMLIFMIGRTSTAPSTSKIGQPFESSTACSKSRASISV
jgi:hypothetical protein